jgi:hypothetical protein
MVPTNGLTIGVTVDGQYRDIRCATTTAAIFATGLPGYTNSNGAVGYYYLDTTQFLQRRAQRRLAGHG